MNLDARLAEQFVIPVLRTADAADAVETASALHAGGLGCVELTMTTPSVHAAVTTLARRGVVVGVGTITDAQQVEASAAAGASFVVSFCRPDGFVPAARAAGVLPMPGGMTPSEVWAAHAAGARWVKLFPGQTVGSSHLRDLRPLMPDVDFMVTGGVGLSADSLTQWRDAGARAVGVGREFGTAAQVGAAEVTRRARRAVELVQALRGQTT